MRGKRKGDNGRKRRGKGQGKEERTVRETGREGRQVTYSLWSICCWHDLLPHMGLSPPQPGSRQLCLLVIGALVRIERQEGEAQVLSDSGPSGQFIVSGPQWRASRHSAVPPPLSQVTLSYWSPTVFLSLESQRWVELHFPALPVP